MSDMVLVDSPLFFPNGCAVCGGQKGPICDTRVNLPGPGDGTRLYFCRNHARAIAVVFGMAKGDKMDELLAASDVLNQKEKEGAEKDEIIAELTSKLAETQRKVKTQAQFIEETQGEIQKRRHIADQVTTLVTELVAV